MAETSMIAPESTGLRRLAVARVIWGLALVLAPGTILGDLPHRRIDRPARTVARILGLRHLTEAAVTGRRRSHGVILAGAAVDAIHAVTFAVLAWLRPDRRRLALSNVATASVFAVTGAVENRRAPSGG